MKILFAITLFIVILLIPACQQPIDPQTIPHAGRAVAPAIDPNATVNGIVEYNGMTFDLGIPNVYFSDGTTLTEMIFKIISLSKNHGDFKKRLSNYLDELVKAGIITKAQRDAVVKALNDNQIP